jgi:hypothetical protein
MPARNRRPRQPRTTVKVMPSVGAEIVLWTPTIAEAEEALTEGTDEVIEAEVVEEEPPRTFTVGTDGEAAEDTEEPTVRIKKSKRPFVMTPYRATELMNVARAGVGLKPVNSPMLYIYANKGAFGLTTSADGRKQVELESFLAWMNEHNAKQLRTRAAKQPEPAKA